MMNREPGLYVATVRGVEGVRVWGPFDPQGTRRLFYVHQYADDPRIHVDTADAYVTDVRPLVVLDPENDADVDAVANAIRDNHEANTIQVGVDWLAVREALRALADPAPALVEPNGLGARVLDGENVWLLMEKGVGAGNGWLLARSGVTTPQQHWTTWDRLADVTIDDHGIGCTCGGTDCPGGAS